MADFSNIKLICFDLDGTLVDSLPDLHLGINAMLDQLALPSCDIEEVKVWIGNGMPQLVERALVHVGISPIDPDYLIDAIKSFKSHYAIFLNTESNLYENVSKTLNALKDKGYKIALVTNKANQFLPELLKYFDIQNCFDLLIGGDSFAKNKPDPMQIEKACEHFSVTKSETVMVGDSRNDILAGKNAKVKTIALSYGYNYGEPISLSKPDIVIDKFNELLKLL